MYHSVLPLYSLLLCGLGYVVALNIQSNDEAYETLMEAIHKRAPNDFFVRTLLHSEPLDIGHQASRPFTLEMETSPICSVARNGSLEVFLRPANALETESFVATIEKETFSLKYPDGTPYKTFILLVIQTPLETLLRTRECFRFYYESVPFGFCAKNTDERDSWMNSLTEAIFCLNGKHQVKEVKLDAGEAIELSPNSTKNQRWIKFVKETKRSLEKEREEKESIPNTAPNATVNEIEISGLLQGKPRVFVNGEKLPLFLDAKQDMDALIEEEENNEEIPVET